MEHTFSTGAQHLNTFPVLRAGQFKGSTRAWGENPLSSRIYFERDMLERPEGNSVWFCSPGSHNFSTQSVRGPGKMPDEECLCDGLLSLHSNSISFS